MILRRSYTIGGIMWATVVIAFGLAALRNASETWAGVTFLATCGVLALAIIGAVCRPAIERPWWLGFTLFGSGYLVLAILDIPGLKTPALPTSRLLDIVAPLFNAVPRSPKFASSAFFHQIGDCLWSLLFGTLGGFLGLLLSRRWVGRTETPDTSPRPADQPRQSRWRRPVLLAFGGLILLVVVTLVGYPWAPELLSKTIYLLTCALIGLAILGALVGRERRRPEWLGVALFGGGYLILNLGADPERPLWADFTPASPLLGTLRPWLFSGGEGASRTPSRHQKH